MSRRRVVSKQGEKAARISICQRPPPKRRTVLFFLHVTFLRDVTATDISHSWPLIVFFRHVYTCITAGELENAVDGNWWHRNTSDGFSNRPEYSACIILQSGGVKGEREGGDLAERRERKRGTRRHNVDAGNLEDSKNRFYNGVPRPRTGSLSPVSVSSREFPRKFFHRARRFHRT